MKVDERGIAHLVLIGIIAALFVSGSGVAVASNGSKPGDTLYSIDRASENVQLALAVTDSLKTTTHIAIAEERLLEIKALLAEKDVNAAGIDVALSNFEEHKSRVSELLGDDGGVDEQEQELENKLGDKKAEIDKLFESQQKLLESQREALKKQYEQALKDGDVAKAATLKAQIDGFENILKEAEEARETQKQEVEEQSEAEKQAAETEQKAAEEQSEATKKALEAQREAEKQAAEQH